MILIYCYKKIINIKIEICKMTLMVILLANYQNIYHLVMGILENRYGENNADYIIRLLIIFQFFIFFIYIVYQYVSFYKNNGESLLLLGLSNNSILLLFCCTHISYFFMQVLLNTILVEAIPELNILSIISGIMNAFLILELGLLFARSLFYKYLDILLCLGAIGIGGLFYSGNFNYLGVYDFLTSSKISTLLYENYWYITFEKAVVFLILLIFLIYFNRGKCWDLERKKIILKKGGFISDLWHILGHRLIWKKNYLFLYRDIDFIVWKIFSSFFLLLGFITLKGEYIMVIISVVVCFITSTYLLSSYNLERNCYFIYYMSQFSYDNALKGQILGSFILIGDNIILLALFMRENLMYFISIMAYIFYISTYINNALYALFPREFSKIHYLKVLIEMHVPGFNIIQLVRNYNKGKENWCGFSCEYKEYFRD